MTRSEPFLKTEPDGESNTRLVRKKALKPPCGMNGDELVRMEEVRNFLCGYQLCADMLQLRKYERKRAKPFLDPCECNDVLNGSENFWRARMFAVGSLIDAMPNGREKLMLYYHYIHGESIEHIADMLDVSRRTGYRIHGKALRRAALIYATRIEKNGASID